MRSTTTTTKSQDVAEQPKGAVPNGHDHSDINVRPDSPTPRSLVQASPGPG